MFHIFFILSVLFGLNWLGSPQPPTFAFPNNIHKIYDRVGFSQASNSVFRNSTHKNNYYHRSEQALYVFLCVYANAYQ